MSENNVVEAKQLEKIFKDFWGRPKASAVAGIDFNIQKGQIFGLLGPNGSGKTTTIKMILGLLYPTSGSLTVLGESPRDVDSKRMIGYLPEETYLYKYLTAGETIDFFGSLFNISQQERLKRTEQLLDMVGLAHVADRTVGEFSKGMARRIGLAQALVNDPDLIILDEPTSGLDPIGCREVKDIIRLMASRGKTVILSSHLLSDVEDLCDNVIVLYGGKIRAKGTLDELLVLGDKTRITTPRISPETLEKIRKLLIAENIEKETIIDNPKMDLEHFFINVVHKAKSESQQTSGAETRTQVAEYLLGSQADEKDLSREVLEQLLEEQKTEFPELSKQNSQKTQDLNNETLIALSENKSKNKQEDISVTIIPKEQTIKEESLRLENILKQKKE